MNQKRRERQRGESVKCSACDGEMFVYSNRLIGLQTHPAFCGVRQRVRYYRCSNPECAATDKRVGAA